MKRAIYFLATALWATSFAQTATVYYPLAEWRATTPLEGEGRMDYGEEFGVFRNSGGSVFRLPADGEEGEPLAIAYAIVERTTDTTATLAIERLRVLPELEPRVGDYVTLPSIPPNLASESPLFDLARRRVEMADIRDRLFFDCEDALLSPDSTRLGRVVQAMLADIRFVADAMLDQGRISATIDAGAFKGMSVYQAMEESDAEDVERFLGNVAENVDRYAGRRWKLTAIYASWLALGAE